VIFFFFFFLFLSFFSVLGYGFAFNKIFNLKFDNLNLGKIGILGLFFLTIISSFTHIFMPHNFIHNIFFISLGFFYFISNFLIRKVSKQNIYYLSIIFILLLSGLILAKNNEDFSYYHLPNTIQFFEQKLQFGLGNLNHGFKHISSIFLLNSMFIFPKIKYFLVNIPNFFLLTFSVYYLIHNIFFRDKVTNTIKTINLVALILILTKFSRLAEYGTDIFGQFLIILVILETIILSYKKKIILNDDKYDFLFINILIIFAFTTKVYFIIYLLFPISIFIFIEKKKQLIQYFLKPKILSIFLVPFFFIILSNFSATGCFIFPISKTCLGNNLYWGLSIDTVNYLNTHYELWAKAGRGPNYMVENSENYVKGFNWITFWFKNYFITKVSDYILVVLFILVVVFSFLSKKKLIFKKNYLLNNKLIFIYGVIFFLFIFWFFKFPQLRYGGYVLVFFVLSIPSIFLFYEINFKNLFLRKKIIGLILISFVIFNFKNILRIKNEINNEYLNNFKNFPLFFVKEIEWSIDYVDGHKVYYVKKSCWAVPSTCVRDLEFNVKKKNNYIFYYRK
tara:strand:+ start:146 stop:1834 length:1689 start_codon:yes stop_codon:yes gene_type:complete